MLTRCLHPNYTHPGEAYSTRRRRELSSNGCSRASAGLMSKLRRVNCLKVIMLRFQGPCSSRFELIRQRCHFGPALNSLLADYIQETGKLWPQQCNCCITNAITFGSTCSGTDIIIPVMQHTFQTLSRMFNVASHAPDTLL